MDGPILLTPPQLRFLTQNLHSYALNPALAGTKYQNGEVAKAIVESLVPRLEELLG